MAQMVSTHPLDSYSWCMTPATLTMITWQPHLGAREGLEPLGSDLEGC